MAGTLGLEQIIQGLQQRQQDRPPDEDLMGALQRASKVEPNLQPENPEPAMWSKILSSIFSGIGDSASAYAGALGGFQADTQSLERLMDRLRQDREVRASNRREVAKAEAETQRRKAELSANELMRRRSQNEAETKRQKEIQDQRLSQALDDARKVPGLNLQGVENTPEAIGAAISRQMEVNAKAKREQEIQDLKAIDERQAARDKAIEGRQAQRETAAATATDDKIQRAQVGPFLASISARARDIVAKNENVDPETERNDFLNDLEDHGLTGEYRDQAIKRFKEKIEPILRAKEAQAIGAEINRKKAEFDAAEKAKKATQSVRAGYGLGS